MIKSLTNISEVSVIDQNGENDILSFSEIEFDDKALGSGGFGSVHNVQSIDGVLKSEFVIKIFTDEDSKQHAYDVVRILHDKLKKRQHLTKTPTYHDKPELLGLPFLVFKGYDNISEKHCVAFLMYNLEKLNYEDYGSDMAKLDEYTLLNIPDKLYLAYQLAKTIDFLHEIKFIHADLSENSLWFNPKRIQLSIIDYDSGYHFDTQDKPTTIGKVGHWIGSRFRNIIGQPKDSSELNTLDRLYEEYWVLANATFEVVFGAMPFFFLSDTDDNSKQSYLKENEWPNIDYSSPLFNKANSQQHQAIILFLKQLEEGGAKELIDAFKKVFNSGYKNERKRLTSKEWKELLFNLNQSLGNPILKSFTADKTKIKRKNEEVEFYFEVNKYDSIYVNNKLVPLNQKSIILNIADSTKVNIRAINDFQTIEDFVEIQAVKVEPKILLFTASKLLRDSEDPIILSWETENANSVSINLIDKELEISGMTEVTPIEKTQYLLTVKGYFDEVLSQEIEVDIIKPNIKFFNWEVNLNKGITNVDISWEVENATSVKISPHVKSQNVNGLEHISISERTEFKLIAKGLFADIENEITAHPFPVPIVKQIFANAPKLELKININNTALNFPENLFTASSIQFTNNVQFNNLDINSTELGSSLEFPKFEDENLLMDKLVEKRIGISDIYHIIMKKIYNTLKK
ncbi:protein kinase family protein [Brumimicrobium aurantiacum]|uniref:Protein kinase domain-containing protein n=1 Tax=Brumimicrobium aurantiacum TaxID=1737063 RepID=A0A3E1EWX3_9FLAO|nr:hypothetical protein [Brumimicrobium aurantiacum]RFC54056.1 hypothetical protein DXU93_10985 [Brumimicrobium aurantiacum]